MLYQFLHHKLEEKVLPNEKSNVTFYLAFASDGFMPSGYEYVIAEKKVKEVPVVKKENNKAPNGI